MFLRSKLLNPLLLIEKQTTLFQCCSFAPVSVIKFHRIGYTHTLARTQTPLHTDMNDSNSNHCYLLITKYVFAYLPKECAGRGTDAVCETSETNEKLELGTSYCHTHAEIIYFLFIFIFNHKSITVIWKI